MLIKKALISSLLAVASAKLYVVKDEAETVVTFPKLEGIDMSGFEQSLKDVKLSMEDATLLRFDQAEGNLEVARLPIEFFNTVMTAKQLAEIIMNDNLKRLLTERLPREKRRMFKDKKLVEEKLAALQERLKDLNANDLGDKVDAVMARIPSRNYKNVSPFLALISNTFKVTIRNLAKLFRFSLNMLIQIGKIVVKDVLAQIVDISKHPAKLFMIADLLLTMFGVDTTIFRAVGGRVMEYVAELQTVSSALSSKGEAVVNAPADGAKSKSFVPVPVLKLLPPHAIDFEGYKKTGGRPLEELENDNGSAESSDEVKIQKAKSGSVGKKGEKNLKSEKNKKKSSSNKNGVSKKSNKNDKKSDNKPTTKSNLNKNNAVKVAREGPKCPITHNKAAVTTTNKPAVTTNNKPAVVEKGKTPHHDQMGSAWYSISSSSTSYESFNSLSTPSEKDAEAVKRTSADKKVVDGKKKVDSRKRDKKRSHRKSGKKGGDKKRRHTNKKDSRKKKHRSNKKDSHKKKHHRK